MTTTDAVAHLAARVRTTLAVRPPGAPVVVALDGRSGSGKTTLARRLTRELRDGGVAVTVLHLDHVYPGWDGLAAASACLGEQLLPRLRAGLSAQYPSWSWVRDRPGPQVEVRPSEVVLVEGVGSGSRTSRSLVDLLVWLEAPEPVRHGRAMARDGDSYAPHWRRWADQEEAYLAAERPERSADVVVLTGDLPDGTRSSPVSPAP
ncbi:adenylyl-sulfate kinase [Aquipuribacter sp. MA13-6]|uniref:adenylyl-sulfate kinase n=1 Tax=Aquipuribacter sp. MA13-6 TaxID=3440839 RepID=UPI003EEF5B2A